LIPIDSDALKTENNVLKHSENITDDENIKMINILNGYQNLIVIKIVYTLHIKYKNIYKI